MNLRIKGLRDWLYLAFGLANLVIAFFMTIGSLFSSVAYGFGMWLLILLPAAFGLIGLFEFRQPLTLFMAFSCTMTIIFVAWSTYSDISVGFPMLRFYKIWLSLSIIEGFLSLLRFKQLRQAIGASS